MTLFFFVAFLLYNTYMPDPIPPIYEIGEQHIPYRILPENDITTPAIDVYVADPTDRQSIEDEIFVRAMVNHWFLGREFREKTPSQKFIIELSPRSEDQESVTVELYNFQSQPLEDARLQEIAGTLGTMFHRLRDKNLWTLQSIQIMDEDVDNPNVDEPAIGLAFSWQFRFQLHPYSFSEGHYEESTGNPIPCTILEAATAHEATHIILETTLHALWQEHREELGWEEVEDAIIELPGGGRTTEFNRSPETCPSEYGSYHADDDRGDSVIAALFQPSRLEETEAPSPKITVVSPQMPTCPLIVARVHQEEPFVFKIGPSRKIGNSPPVIPIAQYRNQRATNTP